MIQNCNSVEFSNRRIFSIIFTEKRAKVPRQRVSTTSISMHKLSEWFISYVFWYRNERLARARAELNWITREKSFFQLKWYFQAKKKHQKTEVSLCRILRLSVKPPLDEIEKEFYFSIFVFSYFLWFILFQISLFRPVKRA